MNFPVDSAIAAAYLTLRYHSTLVSDNETEQ